MRVASWAWWLAALCTTPIFAVPTAQEESGAIIAEEAVHGETPSGGEEGVDYSLFDGIKVPAMIEIEGDKFAETVKDGYWYARNVQYLMVTNNS